MLAAALPRSRSLVADVLVVDDSAVDRAMLAKLIDGSARYRVTGAVGTVAAAIDFLSRTSVNIILLDVMLRGVDALDALPDLIAVGGRAKVIVLSGGAANGGEASVRAAMLGAADTLLKPRAAAMSSQFEATLIDRFDRLVSPSSRDTAAAGALPDPALSRNFDVVAIGASTGGIHALGELLRALPATFRTPILITQHLPASFMPYFAAQIAVLANRPCEVAVDRLRIRPGRAIVAPGDAHLRCVPIGEDEAAIRLSTDPVASGCLPSVDPMFASVAEVYGARALAVVLSGMGRDGADGARRVHEAGGTVIVQDQASSVVWGMPAAVAAQGVHAAILPPAALGRLIAAGKRP